MHFDVQGKGETVRGITVDSQCRGVTTNEATQGKMEPVPGL